MLTCFTLIICPLANPLAAFTTDPVSNRVLFTHAGLALRAAETVNPLASLHPQGPRFCITSHRHSSSFSHSHADPTRFKELFASFLEFLGKIPSGWVNNQGGRYCSLVGLVPVGRSELLLHASGRLLPFPRPVDRPAPLFLHLALAGWSSFSIFLPIRGHSVCVLQAILPQVFL